MYFFFGKWLHLNVLRNKWFCVLILVDKLLVLYGYLNPRSAPGHYHHYLLYKAIIPNAFKRLNAIKICCKLSYVSIPFNQILSNGFIHIIKTYLLNNYQEITVPWFPFFFSYIWWFYHHIRHFQHYIWPYFCRIW